MKKKKMSYILPQVHYESGREVVISQETIIRSFQQVMTTPN